MRLEGAFDGKWNYGGDLVYMATCWRCDVGGFEAYSSRSVEALKILKRKDLVYKVMAARFAAFSFPAMGNTNCTSTATATDRLLAKLAALQRNLHVLCLVGHAAHTVSNHQCPIFSFVPTSRDVRSKSMILPGFYPYPFANLSCCNGWSSLEESQHSSIGVDDFGLLGAYARRYSRGHELAWRSRKQHYPSPKVHVP